MNRLIALNSVPLSGADVAPPTGTPQFATSGNPATQTPATTFPAYAFNMIQEEIMAVVLAAGLTPSSTNYSQLLAAIGALRGGCFPIASTGLVSSTTLGSTLDGYFINAGGSGITLTLPAATASTNMTYGFYAGSAFTLASGGGYIIGAGASTTSLALASNSFICVQSDGSNWRAFSASANLLVSRTYFSPNNFVYKNVDGAIDQTFTATVPCGGGYQSTTLNCLVGFPTQISDVSIWFTGNTPPNYGNPGSISVSTSGTQQVVVTTAYSPFGSLGVAIRARGY